MRLILGMVLGAALLVAGAYYHDNVTTSTATPTAKAGRAMVNWDVVEANWALFKVRVRDGWATLRARIDRA